MKSQKNQSEWKEDFETSFGNGELENETISGYLGDLIYKVECVLATERKKIIDKIQTFIEFSNVNQKGDYIVKLEDFKKLVKNIK